MSHTPSTITILNSEMNETEDQVVNYPEENENRKAIQPAIMPVLSTITIIGEDSQEVNMHELRQNLSIIERAEADVVQPPIIVDRLQQTESRSISLGSSNVLSYRRSSAVPSIVPVQPELSRGAEARTDAPPTPPIIGLRFSRSLPDVQNIGNPPPTAGQQINVLTPRARRRNLISSFFSPRTNRRQTAPHPTNTNNQHRGDVARTSITAVINEQYGPVVQQQRVFHRIRRFFRIWSSNSHGQRKRN